MAKDKKTNLVEELDNIQEVINESTQETLKQLINEKVESFIKGGILSEAEEDEYTVEDEEKVEDGEALDTSSENDDNKEASKDGETEDVLPLEAEPSIEGADSDEDSDVWADLGSFKNGDEEEYDFTSMKDDEVVKIFTLLNGNPDVKVVQDDDSINVNIKDGETGNEKMIVIDKTKLNATNGAEPEEAEEEVYEADLSKLGSILKEMNLGYTDSYQDKSPLSVGSMEEPANPSSVRDWSKGVPKGTEKPWSGNSGDSAPFDEPISESNLEGAECNSDELDELMTTTQGNARKMVKTMTSEPREKNLPQGSKNISVGGEYKGSISESDKKVWGKVKEMMDNYSSLKEIVGKYRTAIQEAMVLNVSLGNAVKLFVEHSTTLDEKRNIVEEFGRVKTINDSKKLYESFSKQLEGKPAAPASIMSEQQLAIPSQEGEKVTKSVSQGQARVISLMERVNNVGK